MKRNTIMTVALATGGLVAAGALAFSSLAVAAPTTPPAAAPGSQAPATQAPGPQAPAQRQWGNGPRDGSGFGAKAHNADLAKALGVSEQAVTDAMAKYRAANGVPAQRGRDLTAEQRTERHAALAKFLAAELKLDEAKVTAALAELQQNRPMQGGRGPRR